MEDRFDERSGLRRKRGQRGRDPCTVEVTEEMSWVCSHRRQGRGGKKKEKKRSGEGIFLRGMGLPFASCMWGKYKFIRAGKEGSESEGCMDGVNGCSR